MKGIKFNDIHSYDDLNLILSAVDIPPALPKTNYVEIEGGNGSIDLTEALGEIHYNDRECSFTLSVLPQDNYEDKKTVVSNLLNGRVVKITLDKDPNYYYLGRCSVNEYASDKMMRQIVIGARVKPFKFKIQETVSTFSLSTEAQTVNLKNGRMSVVPVVELTDTQSIVEKGTSIQMLTGETTAKILDLKVYGKSIQDDGIPNPNVPVDIVNIDVSNNINITAYGKNLIDQTKAIIYNSDVSVWIDNTVTMAYANNKNRIVFIPFDGKKGVKYYINYRVLKNSGINIKFYAPEIEQYWTGNTFTLNENINHIGVFVDNSEWKESSEIVFDNLIISTENIPYTPFVKKEISILFAPNEKKKGWCGIPVEQGGNYTDANGQQWVCDEIDLVKGLQIQRCICKTFSGLENEAWSYDASRNLFYIETGNVVGENNEDSTERIMCNLYQKNTSIWTDNTINYGCLQNRTTFYVRNYECTTIEDFKSKLSVTPLIWLGSPKNYENAISISVADIHTYENATNISNSGNAEMLVEYMLNSMIEFNNDIYTISEGKQKVLGIYLKEGNNELKLTGSGNIKFTYQEGDL